MEREVKNKAASIRAKLVNIARAEKIDFDFLLLQCDKGRFFNTLLLTRRTEYQGFTCG